MSLKGAVMIIPGEHGCGSGFESENFQIGQEFPDMSHLFFIAKFPAAVSYIKETTDVSRESTCQINLRIPSFREDTRSEYP